MATNTSTAFQEAPGSIASSGVISDSTSRDQLIKRYRGYVVQLVKRFERVFGLPPEQHDEFIAAGYMGLVEAANRFASNQGTDFRSFAYLRIRGAVIDAVRETSELSGSAYRYARALAAMNELREQQLSEEQRDRLGQIKEYAAQGALAFRLAFQDHEVEASEFYQEDVLDQQELVERRTLSSRLRQAVKKLPEKEQLIVEEYYFAGKPFVQIVEENESMSKSWVSRLHRRALKNLRELYEEDEHDA